MIFNKKQVYAFYYKGCRGITAGMNGGVLRGVVSYFSLQVINEGLYLYDILKGPSTFLFL